MAKRLPQSTFRRPEQMNLSLGQPRSIRFNPNTETYLEKEAVKAGIGFSTLVSQIANDYVAWLKEERVKES